MLTESQLHVLFNRRSIIDRQVEELIGLARGIVADGVVHPAEAEMLFRWLSANRAVADNGVIAKLYDRLDDVMADGFLDAEEASSLLDTLSNFCGSWSERGELMKATTLPLDVPPPVIDFVGQSFCFTGTFAFGQRKHCEAATASRGGICGTLTRSTNYLVIGSYATDSWAHSAYGRKIEKAMEMKRKQAPIKIVGEAAWAEKLVTAV